MNPTFDSFKKPFSKAKKPRLFHAFSALHQLFGPKFRAFIETFQGSRAHDSSEAPPCDHQLPSRQRRSTGRSRSGPLAADPSGRRARCNLKRLSNAPYSCILYSPHVMLNHIFIHNIHAAQIKGLHLKQIHLTHHQEALPGGALPLLLGERLD